jgi:uncharacterized protein (TIGR02421 family)
VSDAVHAWDRRLVRAVRKIRILGALAWPEHLEHAYARSGTLAEFEVGPPAGLDNWRRELDALAGEICVDGPRSQFLAQTTESMRAACDLLAAIGSPAFTERSIALYGQPSDRLHDGAATHLQAAEHFLALTEGLTAPCGQPTLASHDAGALLQSWVSEHIEGLPVQVTPGLTAKATAGALRVRLRGGTRFSELELRQLLQHEALVHSLTKRNGKAQSQLTSLGLSTPRTTCDQEGLATLAELVTDTMDHRRLRRIALRVVAVHHALSGADFDQIWRLFQDGGQSEAESWASAQRVFRGGTGRGVVFTKDVVYLKGLVRVHSFLLKALQAGRTELVQRLFCGRVTLGDLLTLDPCFEDGTLVEPTNVPPWAQQTGTLAAYLAWVGWQDKLGLASLELSDFQ